MKRSLILCAVALSLGGCANLQRLETALATTVPPKAILVAANTFDALEGTATNYLIYCKANLAQPVCSADNRRIVIRSVRKGRGARDQLEVYITQQTPAPAKLYNVLITAITSLQSSAVSMGGTQ